MHKSLTLFLLQVSHFVPWINDVISNRVAMLPRPISMRVASFDESHEVTPTLKKTDEVKEGKQKEVTENGNDSVTIITTDIV